MLWNVVLVAIGGAAGSVGRYFVGEAVGRAFGTTFPFATLAVNVLGCAVIGFLIPFWTGQHSAHLQARLLLVTGVLGGFTTFSAFGLETYRLLTAGHAVLGLTNIALNVVVGLAAVGMGLKIGHLF